MSTALAHRADPDASHEAARTLADTAQVKSAIRELLAEEPRTDFQLAVAYFNLAELRGWPMVQPHSIARRRSELRHRHHEVRAVLDDDGREVRIPSPDGATATVWELVS